jgi:hypothetical protein
MKILFLCTSLEPGRDGVGDYVRQLAEACIKAGHACHLLALHDSFIDAACVEDQKNIPCVRLPAFGTWEEKTAAAQPHVDAFAPDWLSWQLVPYGFHPKGIIPADAQVLGKLGAGRHSHALLHELWIGLSVGEPFKNRGWGTLQRRALKKFIATLQPEILHTTNFVYKEVLKRAGHQAEILPLFGNIPVEKPMPLMPEPNTWIGGVFGTVHPQLNPKRCFDSLVAGAEVSKRKLRILGLGRLGDYGEKMFTELNNSYKGRMEVEIVGEKTPEEISRLLQNLDFGIATHPWALAGKSGAVAALLDHGLPVVVPRDDWKLRRNPVPVPAIDPLMIKLSEMPPELMAGRLARRRQPAARLPAIAAAFLSSLEATAKSVSTK